MPGTNTNNNPTKLARIPLLMLEQFEQLGLNRDELMRQASLDAGMLDDPDGRVPMQSVVKLWQAIGEHKPGEAIGVRIGGAIKARQLGIVGYAMYYSRDLSVALQRLARYVRIITEAVQFRVVEKGDKTSLVFSTHPALVALRHPVEGQIAAMLAIAREITGTRFTPLAIHLPFPKTGDRDAYQQVYGCPVFFDQTDSEMVLATSQMELPVTASDPALSNYLEELAGITLDSLGGPDEDFVEQVRRALWSELPGGKPSLWNTAAHLGTSARTLQRRLRENGTSYSALLEDMRRELAGDLLADKKLGVADIAFLLGYSEPSAFQRAFRRWRGVSPRQFAAR